MAIPRKLRRLYQQRDKIISSLHNKNIEEEQLSSFKAILKITEKQIVKEEKLWEKQQELELRAKITLDTEREKAAIKIMTAQAIANAKAEATKNKIDSIISGYQGLRDKKIEKEKATQIEEDLKLLYEQDPKLHRLLITQRDYKCSREEAEEIIRQADGENEFSSSVIEFDITQIKTTEQPEELISNEIPILTESSDSASSLDDVLGSILNSSVLKPGERVKIDEAIETVKVTNIENPL